MADSKRDVQDATPVTCFLSCTTLSREWKLVPREEMENAIFFFGSKRSWVFPETKVIFANAFWKFESLEEQIQDSKKQPTNYLGMDKEFRDIIKKKDEEQRVFWLKPEDFNYNGGKRCWDDIKQSPFFHPTWNNMKNRTNKSTLVYILLILASMCEFKQFFKIQNLEKCKYYTT